MITNDVPAGSGEVDALLRDGRVVTLRPIRPEDGQTLMDFHLGVGDQSRRMRFFASGDLLARDYATHLVTGADDGHLTCLALAGDQIVGVASAEPTGGGEADVAFLVADDRQHAGLATLLLEHLAAAGRRSGLVRFTAEVLCENTGMLDVFRHAGFISHSGRPSGGEVSVTLDLAGDRVTRVAVEEREREAAAASLVPLLAPKSVLVVGAGRRSGGVGRAVLTSLTRRGFTGSIAVVNAHVGEGDQIYGMPAFRSATQVPWTPDLAVIAVPAEQVAAAVEDCGRAGVRGVVVISSGFADSGDRDGQRDLVAIAHRHGLRLIGPNCLGVLNTDPGVRLDATFAHITAHSCGRGGVGVATQSGAVGIAVLADAEKRGLSVSTFVSLGNKADVSGNDLMLYWENDPATQVIALYLESIGNARRFRRIAGRIAERKPIVVLRGGRSVAGARAGASHTAAAATPDAVATALFRDTGVIGADSSQELTDLAQLLAVQPVPAGARIAVLSNAGGPAALAADAAAAAGGQLPVFSDQLAERLREALPAAASVANPVDLGSTAGPEAYRAALRLIRDSGEVDAVLPIHVVTGVRPLPAIIDAIEQVIVRDRPRGPTAGPALTFAAALAGGPLPRGGVLPWYGYAESAARVLAKAGDLGEWRARQNLRRGPLDPQGVPSQLESLTSGQVTAVRSLIDAAAVGPSGWLDPADAVRLVELAGIPVCPTLRASGVQAVAAVAAEMTGPVVLKSAAPGLAHKSDSGGVAVGLSTPEDVSEAAGRIAVATGSFEFVVQPMAETGLELLAGLNLPADGVPLILLAAGGVHESVQDDRTLATLPLAPGDAAAMTGRLRSSALLSGHRGSDPLYRDGVVRAVERLAALAGVAPEIRELDINPLTVTGHGVLAVDVKVRLATAGEVNPRRDPVEDFEHDLA